jgi:hypothetical protein
MTAWCLAAAPSSRVMALAWVHALSSSISNIPGLSLLLSTEYDMPRVSGGVLFMSVHCHFILGNWGMGCAKWWEENRYVSSGISTLTFSYCL